MPALDLAPRLSHLCRPRLSCLLVGSGSGCWQHDLPIDSHAMPGIHCHSEESPGLKTALPYGWGRLLPTGQHVTHGRWSMIHHAKGTISRQARVNTPEGTYEEGFGRQGFYGPQATLYHRHPTTDWLRIEGPLQPRALRTYDVMPEDMTGPHGLPTALLYNDDVRIAVSRRRDPMP